MEEIEVQFRKKRELGDIISDSFKFLRSEAGPLFKLLLIYVAPFFILYAIIQNNAQQRLLDSGLLDNPERLMENAIPFYKNVFVSIVFNIFVQTLFAAAFYSYIELYIKKGKNNFTNADVTSILFSNSVIAMGAAIFITLVVFFGIAMCVLPGLYFANTFSLVIIIAIFEKKGMGYSIQLSWKLVNSQWWNTLLLNIVAIVIIIALSMVLSIPVMLSGLSKSVMGLGQVENIEYPSWYWILSGVNSVISSFFYIIPYTFMAFQYFNLRERLGIDD